MSHWTRLNFDIQNLHSILFYSDPIFPLISLHANLNSFLGESLLQTDHQASRFFLCLWIVVHVRKMYFSRR